MLGGALAHRLGGRRAPRGRGQRGVAARSADQCLRCAVRRLDEAHLALQPSQRQHAVLLERAGELFGGDAVDLVSAVGHEVEDEAHLADFLGEGPHLVVGHAGGVPVERRREVVGQHLVGVDARGSRRRTAGRRRGRRSWSPSRGCRRTALRQAISRSHTGCRRGPGSSLPGSSPARSPSRRRHPVPWPSRGPRTATRARRTCASRRRSCPAVRPRARGTRAVRRRPRRRSAARRRPARLRRTATRPCRRARRPIGPRPAATMPPPRRPQPRMPWRSSHVVAAAYSPSGSA